VANESYATVFLIFYFNDWNVSDDNILQTFSKLSMQLSEKTFELEVCSMLLCQLVFASPIDIYHRLITVLPGWFL
jgi:hypothetical protein